MDETSKILHKINALESERRIYKIHLCSYEASKNAEKSKYYNTQLKNLCLELRILYTTLSSITESTKTNKKPVIDNITYTYSNTEKSAIIHFNTDKRFNITE